MRGIILCGDWDLGERWGLVEGGRSWADRLGTLPACEGRADLAGAGQVLPDTGLAGMGVGEADARGNGLAENGVERLI